MGMRRKPVIATLVIALALASVLVLSVVPNPVIKNRLWASLEDVEFYSVSGVISASVDVLLLVIIHNPTHHTYSITVSGGTLDADITTGSGNLHLHLDSPGVTFGTFSQPNLIEFNAHYITVFGCLPAQLGLVFEAQGVVILPNSAEKGTFHLTFNMTDDGSKFVFTDDLTMNFTHAASTATTTSEAYNPPNECLIPWV